MKDRKEDIFGIYVNALNVKTPKEVYRAIYYELTNKTIDTGAAMFKLSIFEVIQTNTLKKELILMSYLS